MKQTLTIILMVMAGVAWGETNKIYVVDNLPIMLVGDAPIKEQVNDIIHLPCRPLNPVIGQSYTFGNDPNTHTYIGGGCWYSTCLHWTTVSVDPVKVQTKDDHPVQSPTNEMKAVSLGVVVHERVFDTTPEQIRELASSGKICEAMGFHCWENIDIIFPGSKRKCKLCDRTEILKKEWVKEK